MDDLKLMVTLWPSFPHFEKFAKDTRLSGIRLNSAMISNYELSGELDLLQPSKYSLPLYFDVKGRQLRVTDVHFNPQYLDISINHPISVRTPVPVYFKADNDMATLLKVEEDGRRLIFDGGPTFMVKPGESLHIHDDSLVASGLQFTQAELEKIATVRQAGFRHYFLSYVQSQRDVDEFVELVGEDSQVMLKIENKKGLEYVAREFKKSDNLVLVAARGDLFVELDHPTDIVAALRLIIGKDPKACAGSRVLLSMQQPQLAEFKRAFQYIAKHQPDERKIQEIMEYVYSPQTPSCADICELAWLTDIGYRNIMLCDEICLKDKLLSAAVDAFEDFRHSLADW